MSCAGDEMESFQDILKFASESGNKSVRAHVLTHQMDVLAIFQDWNSAADLLLEAGNLRTDTKAIFGSVRFTFLEALISIKVAQASTSRASKTKWKRRAAKSMKIIHSWLKKGNVNVVHMMHILTAEFAALKGNGAKAEEQFKLAITASTKNGFLQDKGLTHELTGKFYLAQGDTSSARYHLERAEVSFSDWCATGKVERLVEQKKALLGE